MPSRVTCRLRKCRLDLPSNGRKFGVLQPAALRHTAFALAMLCALLPITVQTMQAQTETVLYNFCSLSGCADGNLPIARLTADSSGNLYGTTWYGGAWICCGGGGTVFKLSPETANGCPSGSNQGNGWCETVLFSFCPECVEGSNPSYSYVTFDTSGNLYGTTLNGGIYDDGVAFELSPEPLGGCPSGTNPGNGWCETVLYNFGGPVPDGATSPFSGLVWDSSGNLYGTALGGAHNFGSVYELSPNGSDGWTEQVIYSSKCIRFSAGLAVDASGSLYGVDCKRKGHVFKLSLVNGVWTPTVIHAFTGWPKDGADPYSAPTLDSAGNLYGTTVHGGRKHKGTVWKLTPMTTGKDAGTYKEEILHSFTSEKTGDYPWAGVTVDSAGSIYGTTPNNPGGCENCGKYGAYGAVFEIAVSGTTHKYKLLWNFNGPDGQGTLSNPILDSSGNLYGVTPWGGAEYSGTVYEVSPITTTSQERKVQ